MRDTLGRLVGVFIAGLLTLAMVLGSIRLAQLDPSLAFIRPTRVSQAPTATYYPTAAQPSLTPALSTSTPVPTPTARSPLIAQCTPPSGWRPYTVREGETLYILAQRAGTYVQVLVRGNCLGVPEVQPGEIIYLPPVAVASPTRVAYTCGPPPGWRIVRVRPGDTLYSLALWYGTTIEAIRRANCLQGYRISVGQPLYLPSSMAITPTWTPRPTSTSTPRPTLTTTPGTPRPTPTASSTPTTTVEPTVTVTPTLSVTPTPTLTPTPTPTPTESPTTTVTLTPTPTPTGTPEGSPTPTSTPGPTSTGEAPTATPTPTATSALSTDTPAPTATSTPRPTSTSTPQPSPEPTSTSAATEEPDGS